ncbi:hypothetical protein I41_29430 [Lacipirellula limnantheis]|uniref:Uncharacterized protein n=2 Tax=Lacipirellula limnantheis TaxID=2528024 RepID=A0A517TZG2_9BACT|nr:hypothetical protein I41_29430 [Lacipirellula limnantheis]
MNHWCALAAIGLAALGAAPSALAQTGFQPRQVPNVPMQANFLARGPRGEVVIASTSEGLTVPVGTNGPEYSRRNGLQLSVKSEWPGQYGYHPVSVTVRAEKPAASDRTLEFRFTVGDWNFASNGVKARQRFVLEQGQTKATLQLLVPQLTNWQRSQWELYVDGSRDDEFTVSQVDVGSLRFNMANNPADVAAVGVMLTDSQRYAVTADLGLAYSNGSALFQEMAPTELPTDWLAYSSLNVVVLPANRLPELIERHPVQARALLRWVATGGNLWLIGAGRQWEELAAVEQSLSTRDVRPLNAAEDRADVASGEKDAASDDNRTLPPTWRFAPLDNRALEPAEGALVLAGYPVDEAVATKERLKPTPKPRPDDVSAIDASVPAWGPNDGNLPKTSADWFAVRGWGMGAITAFRRDLHSASERDNQKAANVISQSLLAPRQQWGGRFGSVPNDSNVDFNNWLIPGVGMAPVGSFQVLITLFALGIGPLTYWFLRRMGKLPMLVAIVPAAAILTTLSLFAYGVLIDGVAARVRGRSVTVLDQRTGECAAWGRYSYYAGIAPRGGIAVPPDQAMFPILPNWSPIFGFGGRSSMTEREVVWDDQQRLTRGWLASRTPTQYHAIAARKSDKRLDLRVTAEGLRLTNRLGAELVGAAVQDHDGSFYWCETLPADKGVIVPPLQQNQVASRVRRLFTENLPELPAGDDGRRNSSGYYSFAVSDSLMEGRLGAINSPQVTGWGPGRYIAFTATAIELTPGVDGIDESDSFHVIEGSW